MILSLRIRNPAQAFVALTETELGTSSERAKLVEMIVNGDDAGAIVSLLNHFEEQRLQSRREKGRYGFKFSYIIPDVEIIVCLEKVCNRISPRDAVSLIRWVVHDSECADTFTQPLVECVLKGKRGSYAIEALSKLPLNERFRALRKRLLVRALRRKPESWLEAEIYSWPQVLLWPEESDLLVAKVRSYKGSYWAYLLLKLASEYSHRNDWQYIKWVPDAEMLTQQQKEVLLKIISSRSDKYPAEIILNTGISSYRDEREKVQERLLGRQCTEEETKALVGALVRHATLVGKLISTRKITERWYWEAYWRIDDAEKFLAEKQYQQYLSKRQVSRLKKSIEDSGRWVRSINETIPCMNEKRVDTDSEKERS